ncbi:hypothetical protein [Allokutzneria sp. NRRL B-24872]|uniref:hypothetical protein n=1 Tax=Allokutzneria sp. NRRL B-24872 TaxID=1137961 RepID=UPI000A3B2D92|nr:hypothetical protein [Allokutzneria sp. NRRL B-24872]
MDLHLPDVIELDSLEKEIILDAYTSACRLVTQHGQNESWKTRTAVHWLMSPFRPEGEAGFRQLADLLELRDFTWKPQVIDPRQAQAVLTDDTTTLEVIGKIGIQANGYRPDYRALATKHQHLFLHLGTRTRSRGSNVRRYCTAHARSGVIWATSSAMT